MVESLSSSFFLIFVFGLISTLLEQTLAGHVPIIINTWAFDQANEAGWSVLSQNGTALDAIVAACSKCEQMQCDHTVGWGGSPDEHGETTLDAMIMDGPSHKIGSVGALRQVKNAIGVARAILEHSTHTMLVGDQATEFALAMGFKKEDLKSKWSQDTFEEWKKSNCQPNYWLNVVPDPTKHCGPYQPDGQELNYRENYHLIDQDNHDTIGAVAIDHDGKIASGTSTNGMRHKIPGRVGDSPIPGAGSYADQEVGGAAATGDGDVIMRYLASYQAVENLRQGMEPSKAGQYALRRILKKYPEAKVGIVVVDKDGNFGAACINLEDGFPFSVRGANIPAAKHSVSCENNSDDWESNSSSIVNLTMFLLIIPFVSTFILF